jgi:hypothetical protein
MHHGFIWSLTHCQSNGIIWVRRCGRLAQSVEQLLYTQHVGGSSPSSPTSSTVANQGVVAQSVRVTACHAVGRGFEPRQPRQFETREPPGSLFFVCTLEHRARNRDRLRAEGAKARRSSGASQPCRRRRMAEHVTAGFGQKPKPGSSPVSPASSKRGSHPAPFFRMHIGAQDSNPRSVHGWSSSNPDAASSFLQAWVSVSSHSTTSITCHTFTPRCIRAGHPRPQGVSRKSCRA